MRAISHFINGQSVTRAGAVTSPVYDPGTGEVQARLGTATPQSWRRQSRSPRRRNPPGPR